MSTEFEAVIGLEVHAQLATNTKLFCGCRAKMPEGMSVADEQVNRNTCPICAGHPGTLPVLNRKAVEYAIQAGLATECQINPLSVFSRKNYFYPDLPKGYQVSQYDLPLCENGKIEIETSAGPKTIRIERIHMEEDAGKNVHMSGFSVVNLNRAGVPLIEIVSKPDIKTSEEASQYLKALHAIVTHIGVCDGNMQEGNFRCDANVSVRPRGQEKLGTRTETKNVNSFKFVEKAIEFEIARQIEVIKSGGKIVQETRLYDSAKNVTKSMRSKEEAHDYRYFPEPDLIPLQIKESQIEALKENLPELPLQKKKRLQEEYGLKPYDAGVITSQQSLSRLFEEAIICLKDGNKDDAKTIKTVANLLTGEVSRLMNEESVDVSDSQLNAKHLSDIASLFVKSEISSTASKQLIAEVWKKDEEVGKLVDSLGLKQMSDTGAIEKIVDTVIAQNPTQVEQFKAGKDKLLGFFVGQVMKASQGKANPEMAAELVRRKLK